MFGFLKRLIRRNFGIDKEYYRFVDEMFGFVPNNIELYKLALIHKSASQSIGGHHINNERLEFLGDAVIESVTSDYLYIEFPDKNEGFMTQLRAKIVSRQSLNDIARKIGLDKYVVYNSGGNFTQKHIYGDAFEAMMGAIYLDQGYEFVNRLLINNIYYNHLSIDSLTESETDFKSRLIEWCQKNRHNVVFRTRSDARAPHTAPTFYSTVLIDGIEVGHGVGDSKKVAEQSAAASLSHEMSDEECAELLDKFDRLAPKTELAAPKAEQVEKSESVEKSEKPKRRRRSSKPKSVAIAEQAPKAEVVAEVTEKVEATEKVEVAEKPKKAPKSPKTTKTAKTEKTVKAETTAQNEKAPKAKKTVKTAVDKSEQPAHEANVAGEELTPKPKRRRRPSKPKSEKSAQVESAPNSEAASA